LYERGKRFKGNGRGRTKPGWPAEGKLKRSTTEPTLSTMEKETIRFIIARKRGEKGEGRSGRKGEEKGRMTEETGEGQKRGVPNWSPALEELKRCREGWDE